MPSIISQSHALLNQNLSAGEVPGEWRVREVQIGRHIAPASGSIPHFVRRYAEVYGGLLAGASVSEFARASAVVNSIAAHHRLLWVHPFVDGNGRVSRLITSCMMNVCGLPVRRVFSFSRAMSKDRDQYYLRLSGADQHRMGDYDGRGNLSEKRLAEFCEFVLEALISEVRYMQKVLSAVKPCKSNDGAGEQILHALLA